MKTTNDKTMEISFKFIQENIKTIGDLKKLVSEVLKEWQQKQTQNKNQEKNLIK